mmetsp:Transcript_240/g.429  ORF Transcript_240/g.429 Transcript_240/m.429 type:complete len:181 (+) Transcript_240:115-657(+)|eukprot:CAMPEP_0184691666 /NCGR_PEP_ID=MMETSP0313-20130426/443_1 /TAXON_ID=2792 /ORGANISM="Porphyridium aerugineum, Strain SAG 1380-2" /LENGTH=180 /DNA_ID=CAMNT_0027149421 /DNA_START=100 /DNA_END=642 /DNA_ORIENTATION=+
MEDEALQNLKIAFRAFDHDNSGTIDIGELSIMLRAFGENLTDEELNTMFIKFDVNKSGSLDFGEFLRFITTSLDPQKFPVSDEEVFRVFDKNLDGSVSKEELHAVFKSINADISWEQTELMMDEAGLKDGFVTYEDFLRIKKMVEKAAQEEEEAGNAQHASDMKSEDLGSQNVTSGEVHK